MEGELGGGGDGRRARESYGMCQKIFALPFNETERNGSFCSSLIIFCYPFWIRS